MAHDGPVFFDDDAVFNAYMAGRKRVDNPNDTLEKPVILELVGDMTDRRVLDLGCGDAAFGREALAHGCQSYLGLEGSRLALHYVENIARVFTLIHQTLVPNGRFVFSVEHPVITSCDRGWQGNGPRQDWIVDDYFKTGPRVRTWLEGQVVRYHRTVENYFVGLQRAGFVVESLREAEPRRRWFEDAKTYRRRQRIPLFLIMAGTRP